MVTADSLANSRLAEQLRFFLDDNYPVLHFPDWETLPYDSFSPDESIISERLLTLSHLQHLQQGIVLVGLNSLMQRMAPVNYLGAHSLVLDQGEKLDFKAFCTRLQAAGYLRVSQVYQHGEYALRGSILDLFPMGHKEPYRIELFDNEIESLRSFDPDTQLSLQQVSSIKILPAHEYPLNETGITCFRQQWREQFNGNPSECPLYQDVSQGIHVAGLEYYLPLFFTENASFFDYLPQNACLVRDRRLNKICDTLWQQLNERYDQLGHDRTRPILQPNHIAMPPQALFAKMNSHPQIELSDEPTCLDTDYIDSIKNISISQQHEQPFAQLDRLSTTT